MMKRLFVSLAVVFLGCLAVPCTLDAQDGAYYGERGNALYDKGDYDMAIANINQALRLFSPDETANIALAYYNLGRCWDAKKEQDKAIAYYNQSLAVNPNYANTYMNRGNVWSDKGEYDKALADYNQSLAVNPNDAASYCNRGGIWEKKGEYGKALADYNEALRLYNPNDTDIDRDVSTTAHNALGWLYATCPDKKYRDGKKAFENANKAYQSSGGNDWDKIDTLAAAYAESGDFEKAKEWEAKAIAMAATDKSATDEDKAEAKARLELYQQGKAYRQELKKK
jgi:tetratricopeptide (TPR) repeat protein